MLRSRGMLLWFSTILVLLLTSNFQVSGQSNGNLMVLQLNQSFSIQASSPAFPNLAQPNSLIFPFFPQIQQVSNAALDNTSAFVFPCFFESPAIAGSSSLSSTIFALCLTGIAPYQNPTSPLRGLPAIIWRANRHTPALGKIISLTLQEDGDLVLHGSGKDGVDTVAWKSNTSGIGVARMELSQQPPNLILYDYDNISLWQSSDYPADALTFGQSLEEGMKLVSYASSENMSNGEYSLEINSTIHQLTLFFKKYASSQAIPYWVWQLNSTSASTVGARGCGPEVVRCNAAKMGPANEFAAFITSEGFSVGDPSDGGNYSTIQGLSYSISQPDLQRAILRLDADGSLRLISIENSWVVLADLFSAEDACYLPQACGSYGVCVGAKQCKCPDVGASASTLTAITRVSSFVASDPNDPSKGCVLASPLPTCNNATIATNAQSNSSAQSQQQVQMQPIQGMDYFSTLEESFQIIFNVSNGDNCSTLCLLNCACLAAFWHADLHICSHISEQQMGSFRGGVNSTIYKTYLKVSALPAPPGVAPSLPPSPLYSPIQQSHGNKIATDVGISVAALFVFASISLFFLWHKHRIRKSEAIALVSVDDDILGNATMLKLPPRYSYSELHEATKGFSHRLGKGGFGSVYAGVLGDDTIKVAVKKLEGMRQGEKEFKTELAIMGGIHHYNLLQLMGYCAEGVDRRLLVYKYMENGSLDQFLFASSSTRSTLSEDEASEYAMTRLKWGVRYEIAVGVAKGLAYLHEGCEKRIIHLDIKPQNILLDEGFVAKVADFGLSKGMEREESHVVTTMRGTPGYLAPEWLKDGTIDVKCDVFSFGMLLMEIVSGRKNVDTSKTEAPFYPEWAYSQLVSDKLLESNCESNGHHKNDSSSMVGKPYDFLHKICTIDELTDSKLESEEERGQVWCLIMTAFLCVLEKPEWRPSMSKVVHMLEGHVSLSHIDLSSLHQGLIFVLGSHNSPSSGSHAYNSRALALRREFQEQLGSILALSSTSSPASFNTGDCSQVSGR